jgi:hypothetical protein
VRGGLPLELRRAPPDRGSWIYRFVGGDAISKAALVDSEYNFWILPSNTNE